MNRSSFVSSALALLFVVACGPNLKKLELRQANDALARNDYLVAAQHFKRACELDPNDAEVCAQATRVADRAVNESTDAAKADIASGRYADAIARLNKIRKMDRQDKVGPLLDEVGDKLAAQCESHATTTLAESIRLVRCLEANRVAIDRASYSARVGKGRARAGEVAAKIAEGNVGQQLHGTAYAQYGIALCLSGDGRYEPAKNAEYARFYERANIRTTMHTRLPWSTPQIEPVRHCEAVAKNRPLLNCEGGSGQNALVTALDVTASAVAHNVRSEPREIEYVDHIETYPNPDWAPIKRDYERERRAMFDDARDYDRANARCESASSAWRRANSCARCAENDRREATCNAAEAARTTHNRRVDDVNRLKSQLDNTPRTLEREVRDIFRYTERQHHYSQAYRFTGSATSLGQVTPWNDEGRVDYDVIEHVGFAKANLEARPLIVPRAEQYRREITDRAFAYGVRMVEADLQSRSQTKLASCGTPRDAASLECWMEGQALNVTDPMVPYTSLLSNEVGNAFPPAGCR